MRKDNLVIFITSRGTLCDEGAKQLSKLGKLPTYKNLTLVRGKVTKLGTKNLISLVIKEKDGTILDEEILNDALESLLSITRELELQTISISKTNKINNVQWGYIQQRLGDLFDTENYMIHICKNLVRIPDEDEREDLIRENHSSSLGHKGVTKTYNRLRKRYFWENMKQHIKTFIQNCLDCQQNKLVRVKNKQPMLLTSTPGSAFDKVALDVVDPLTQTQKGNKYILTIHDQLTKFSLAIPLASITLVDIADALISCLICKFGAPRAVLTDQGTNFLSTLIKALMRKFKIKQFKTTAFYPQSNGSLERSHQVLIEYLKQFTDKDKNWDEWVNTAMFPYNTSVHEETCFTPYELVFGKIARVPTSDPPLDEEMDRTYLDYYMSLVNKINRTQEAAQRNFMKLKEVSTKYYNKRIHPQVLKKGDEVFLVKEPATKFDDQYTGHHKILKMLPQNNIKIQIDNRVKIVNPSKLRISKMIK